MLDINLVRNKPDWVKEQLGKLFDEQAVNRIDDVLALDAKRRELLQETEALKGYRNRLSKATGRLRGDKKTPLTSRLPLAQALLKLLESEDFDGAEALLENPPPAVDEADDSVFNQTMESVFSAMKNIGEAIGAIDGQVNQVESELEDNMLWLPNLPHESVPVAQSDDENVPHPEKGTRRNYEFEVKPHWELGPELGIIDFERGVKLAGTRFYVLAGMGARLQRALTSFLLDELGQVGFQELYVPLLLREHALYGSGQFPKFMDTSYQVEGGEFYLLPTSEVAIVNMYADETFTEAEMPRYHMAHTPCFRQEKMSAGRDVRGIKRVHQFQKVEMIKIVTPENSYAELESMTEMSESLVEKLGLPYRRLEIVTGDLGFTATKKYDVEAWSPGSQEWLEISSCSNTEDFQARRANIKYRPEEGGKPQFVHMLNGSALGIPRVLIAILENYQTEDGCVIIPKVLRPYLGGLEIIEPV